jgi:hypothetical protein
MDVRSRGVCWAILAGALHVTRVASFGTNLPVMVIYTRNKVIPSASLLPGVFLSDLVAGMEVSQAHAAEIVRGCTELGASSLGQVYDPPSGGTSTLDLPRTKYNIKIRERGKSSQTYPKKSYTIGFAHPNGTSTANSLFGFPKEVRSAPLLRPVPAHAGSCARLSFCAISHTGGLGA